MFFKAGEVSAVWVTGLEIEKTFNLLIWDSFQINFICNVQNSSCRSDVIKTTLICKQFKSCRRQ